MTEQQAPAQDETPETPPQEGERTEESYQEQIERLNRENADRRVKAKQVADERDALAQQLDDWKTGIGKALGFVADEPADYAQRLQEMTSERDAHQSTVAELQRENTVLRIAQREGVDGDALLDSRRFGAALAALDPADDGYEAQVTTLVKQSAPKDALPGNSGPERHGGQADKYSVDFFRRSHSTK